MTIKNVAMSALAFAAMQLSTAAGASVYVIDDFAHAASDPFSTTLDTGVATHLDRTSTYTIGGASITRTLSFNLDYDQFGTIGGQAAVLKVGNIPGNQANQLSVNNGNGVRSTLTLDYAIGSLVSYLTSNPEADFIITFADAVNTSTPGILSASVSGSSAGTQYLTQKIGTGTGNATSKSISFSLAGLSLTPDSHLVFSFSGPVNFDYTINTISIATTNSIAPDAVPEPAMLGLFGLGAIGLGFARRRKR